MDQYTIDPQKLAIQATQRMIGLAMNKGIHSWFINHFLTGYPILPWSTSSVISRRPRQNRDIVSISSMTLIIEYHRLQLELILQQERQTLQSLDPLDEHRSKLLFRNRSNGLHHPHPEHQIAYGL